MVRVIYFLFFFPFFLFSQEKIKIQYEDGIEELIAKHRKIQETSYSYERGIAGWRIQIGFANKESEITPKHIEFMKKYPEIPIYLTYTAPYYRLRIGNFRTKLEAEKIKAHISDYYQGYIVRDYIKRSLE